LRDEALRGGYRHGSKEVAGRSEQNRVLARVPSLPPAFAMRQSLTKLFTCAGAMLVILFIREANSQVLPTRPTVISNPSVSKCLDILAFESLPLNRDNNKAMVDAANTKFFLDYYEVNGWLEGFLSARGLFDTTTDGDIMKGTRPAEWMTWIYSYCRANPHETIVNAALQLSYALYGNRNAK
jgi:hypothetical protein